MARPSEFSEEVVTLICERMQEGETLRQICKDPQLPERSTIYRWLEKNAEFRNRYARAREALMDFYADEIIEVAWDTSQDTIKGKDGQDLCNHEWINRSRLKVDSMKFLMSKLHPGRYGEMLTINPADAGEPVYQLTRIERVIVRPEIAPPPPPAQITYDPGPLPARIDPEILARFLRMIKDTIPRADQRPADEVLTLALDVCERALKAEFL